MKRKTSTAPARWLFRDRMGWGAICLSVAALLALSGCTVPASDDSTSSASSESSSATASETDATVSFETVATSFDAAALDLDYSNRDQDATYDDASATHIALTSSAATVDGDGASTDGSTVTITAEGVYVVSGTLDDGQLVVEAPEDAKVQIVLAGVTIHNEDGPAVYVKQADKCFITLADGTQNALTDGETYVLEDDSDEPYATLFSRADLTLNGTGTLNVTGSYRHAVCSKDDLVITGGTYVVNAVEDALRGRDCVKIADGDFTLTAGGDGIQAQTYLRIAGGELDITAADDALHSDLEGILSGGTLTIEAGDDAFHAETKLVIDDGTVNVKACYEGYEAEKLYINGGNTHIVASDDAINAAAADLSDGNTDTDADTATNTDTATNAAPTPPDGMGDGEAPNGDMSDMGDMPTGEMPDGEMPGGTPPSGDSGESMNERELNGGAPDNAFDEGGTGGMGMGDENCLIQINGGYTVLDAAGDGVDSNGNVEITGGVLLVNGPTSGGDGAFDYDLTSTVTGGTVVMVGSTGMAQNFTSGEQPFAFTTASGNAGDSVAVVDGDGTVVASLTAAKQFGMVLATSPAFTEGGTYSLVIGGTVTGANADGYTDSGTVSGGSTAEIIASTTASGGMGGLGMGGGGMPAGQGGDVQRGMRGGSTA